MRILVIDDEKLVRTMIQSQLQMKHSLVTADSADAARLLLEKYAVDLIFLDLQLDQSEEPAGLSLLRDIRVLNPNVIIIVMTGLDDSKLIGRCFELGATDYFFKPIVPEKLELVIQKSKIVQQLIRQNQTMRSHVGQKVFSKTEIKTKSPKFQRILDQAKKLKGKNISILLLGETGVGKEIMAQHIWSLENDPCRPFIPVNCAAITPTLAESELFGHKKGSFSGAIENRIGKFEQADGGDIFLDEVATLSLESQQKLLRVLNNGEITPVGQNVPKKVNCRVIAATNEDLETIVKEKLFREDLLFRLNQITLRIPPLRERKEDIPELINGFLLEAGYTHITLSQDAMAFCVEYSWSGNIRELKAVIQTAAILSDSNTLETADLRAQTRIIPGLKTDLSKSSDAPMSALNGNF
ncbi:MAG: sigma-54-dependent Fis family transcriptional regulator [Bdellovibrio sp.]|nr:sigma-54-dependent Fis family transcriptional regulator [Bdellovibrio sp.]